MLAPTRSCCGRSVTVQDAHSVSLTRKESEMKKATTLGLGLVLAALVVVGCSPPSSSTTTSKDKESGKNGDHAHGNGPNDGVVFDLGKYHAEFTVDHKKKTCMVL